MTLDCFHFATVLQNSPFFKKGKEEEGERLKLFVVTVANLKIDQVL